MERVRNCSKSQHKALFFRCQASNCATDRKQYYALVTINDMKLIADDIIPDENDGTDVFHRKADDYFDYTENVRPSEK